MYIWILLATIMVALSFFNTSPREDKASVFTEIKASTFINRFRAEHTGYFRTLECDILYNSNRYENSIIPVQKSDIENLGYTSLASNLPIGYNENDNGQVIYHGIYCFDKDLREEGAALTNCNTTAAQRYLFSFSGISERWTSKTKYSVTLPDTVTNNYRGKVADIFAPVPAFSNYLAKELHGIKNTGWMYCADNKCYLVGRSSIQTLYDKNAAKNEYEQKADGTYGIKKSGTNPAKDTDRHKYITLHLPAADSLGSDFMDTCSTNGMPCMFSAEKFKTTDTSGHCRGLMNSANNNNTGTN